VVVKKKKDLRTENNYQCKKSFSNDDKKEKEEKIAEDKSSLIPATFSQDSVSGKLNLSTLFFPLP